MVSDRNFCWKLCFKVCCYPLSKTSRLIFSKASVSLHKLFKLKRSKGSLICITLRWWGLSTSEISLTLSGLFISEECKLRDSIHRSRLQDFTCSRMHKSSQDATEMMTLCRRENLLKSNISFRWVEKGTELRKSANFWDGGKRYLAA